MTNDVMRKALRRGAVGLGVILAVLLVGLVGVYILAISNYDNARHAHDEDRAPACLLARHYVYQQTAGQPRQAGILLYNATGCPQVLKALHE